MTTLMISHATHSTRPVPGVASVRMYFGIEWEMLSRSPEGRRQQRRRT